MPLTRFTIRTASHGHDFVISFTPDFESLALARAQILLWLDATEIPLDEAGADRLFEQMQRLAVRHCGTADAG